jgi:hypothetical protein
MPASIYPHCIPAVIGSKSSLPPAITPGITCNNAGFNACVSAQGFKKSGITIANSCPSLEHFSRYTFIKGPELRDCIIIFFQVIFQVLPGIGLWVLVCIVADMLGDPFEYRYYLIMF